MSRELKKYDERKATGWLTEHLPTRKIAYYEGVFVVTLSKLETTH